MRKIIISIIIISLSGCLATTPKRQVIAPKTAYTQIGAIVYSPDESGWAVAKSNKYETAFGKYYDSSSDTTITHTVIFRVAGIDKDTDFLNYIIEQRIKNDENNRYKLLNIKNEKVSFKNTACLKYRLLSEDHQSSGINSNNFLYFYNIGYVCRHPYNKELAFQMEMSHRSDKKKYPTELKSVGEHFFDNIQFNRKGIN